MIKGKMNKYFVLFLLGIVVVGLVGCSSTGQPKVDFAYQTGVGHAVAMVADHMGFFAEQGLEVETKVFNSGPAINEAIASGDVDFGTMGDTPALMAVAGNLPVKILVSPSGGESRERLMVKKNSEIDSVEELAGKKIGIKKGTSAHGGFFRLADNYDLDPDQVSITDVRPPDMADALTTDQVDAILSWEPTPTVIEAEGIGRELTTLADTGNQYPIFLVANDSYLQTNEKETVKILQALQKAVEFIQKNPEEAAEIVAEVTGLSPELAKKSMDYHYYKLSLDQDIMDSLKETAEFLRDSDNISEIPDLEEAVEDSYLQQLN